MEIFFYGLLLGLIPAMIAQSKGRSFVGWWFYGLLLFLIALPHSLIISVDKKHEEKKQLAEGMKKCPKCAEFIKPEAVICRFCSHEFKVLSEDDINEGLSQIELGNKYKIKYDLDKEMHIYNDQEYASFKGALVDAVADSKKSQA